MLSVSTCQHISVFLFILETLFFPSDINKLIIYNVLVYYECPKINVQKQEILIRSYPKSRMDCSVDCIKTGAQNQPRGQGHQTRLDNGNDTIS